MSLDYTLAVLTHPSGAGTIGRALDSFSDKVKPKPTRTLIYCDGGSRAPLIPPNLNAVCLLDPEQRGFCQATRRLWRWAADQETKFVFWLEHDFTFLRPVDLEELARPLIEEWSVCQMQLMRTAVSREEIAAGGLFQMRWADYQPRIWLPDGLAESDVPKETRSWQEHRAYFTTNPSLMRSEFMAVRAWPDDGEPHCEGRFGIKLVEDGYSFGVWGSGEPWVEHIGRRDGFGY